MLQLKCIIYDWKKKETGYHSILVLLFQEQKQQTKRLHEERYVFGIIQLK